jgi:alkaline phosphatase
MLISHSAKIFKQFKEKNVKYILEDFRIFLYALLIAAAFASAQSCAFRETELPKSIILIIGDGMGVAHLTAGKYQKGNLSLEKFTTAGLLTTHSVDCFATDSAAAGTALATGEKTCNYRVAVDCSGKPIKTVLEWAEELKMSTGIVVTSAVTDATPAAFMAHVENRFRQSQIAEQIVDSGVEVLFGGGWIYFVPKSEEGSRRSDEKDLLAQLKERMAVVRTAGEFNNLGNDTASVGFFASNYLPDAKKRQPSLASLVQKALAILSKNENGFFLMIEGSQIDRAGHDNDSSSLIEEVLDLDDAIKAAFDFAVEDGETLVVVTSDHETGGFALHQGSVKDKSITETAFTSIGHTASMVPLFAFGPGEEVFAGIHDNTWVGRMLIHCIRKVPNDSEFQP